MIHELRAAEGERLLVLDGGGNSDNGDEIGLFTAQALGHALELIAPDAIGIGEEEASFGLPFLEAAFLSRDSLAMLSANVVKADGGQRIAAPYSIHEAGGARVAVISVANPEVDRTFVKHRAPGLSALAVEPILDALVAELAPQVDLIVAMLHVGAERARELGRRYQTPMLILTGGSHIREAPWGPHPVAPDSKVLAAGVGGLGQWLGIYDVTTNPIVGSVAVVARNRELTEGVVREDAALRAVVDEYNQELERFVIGDAAERAAALATATGEGNPAYRGSGACFPCHDAILKHFIGTPHGNAFHSLERTPSRRNNPHCLSCHTTFFNMVETPGHEGKRAIFADVGVGCEECHGPAGNHPDDPGRIEERRGFVPVTESVCLRCHTPEQTPGFSFETHWPKVMHPVGTSRGQR